jgi:hypothetical protein
MTDTQWGLLIPSVLALIAAITALVRAEIAKLNADAARVVSVNNSNRVGTLTNRVGNLETGMSMHLGLTDAGTLTPHTDDGTHGTPGSIV